MHYLVSYILRIESVHGISGSTYLLCTLSAETTISSEDEMTALVLSMLINGRKSVMKAESSVCMCAILVVWNDLTFCNL